MTDMLHRDDPARRIALVSELLAAVPVPDAALTALVRLAGATRGETVGLVLFDTLAHWLATSAAPPAAPPRVPADGAWLAGLLEAEVPQVSGSLAGLALRIDGQSVGAVCVFASADEPLEASVGARLRELGAAAGGLLGSRLNEARARRLAERLDRASQAGSDWLWETDAEGVLTWVSDSARLHTGWPPEREIGMHALDLNHPPGGVLRDSWDRFREARARMAPFRDAIAMRDSANGRILVAMSGRPTFDADGRFRGYRGAARAVDDEVRAQVQVAYQRERLIESEARVAAVLEAIPDLWFVFDAEGRHLRCSDDQHPLLVQPFDALRGRSMHDVLEPDHAEAGHAAIRTALATGRLQRFEYELRCNDGVLRRFEARVSPMPGGQALYLTRDLTELRQLELDMRVMQRALEADASLPIVVCDALRPDLPAIYVNRPFERLTGWPRAEVLGRNLRMLQCEATEPAALARLREAIALQQDCKVAITNQRRDGSRFINQMHLAPVHDDAGRVVQYIGVLDDATERLRSAQRLQYSEELYRSLATAISDGLIVVDADGSIVTVNPAGSAILGVEIDALVGGGLRRHGFALLYEDGRPVPEQEHPVRRVLHGTTGIADQVYRLRTARGDERLVSLNVQPLRQVPRGKPVSCVVTFRDITQARRAGEALRDKQAAELANRAKSDFLSRVSHEMRTPLNAVIGFTQLLRHDAGTADAAKVTDYADHVLRAGEHLLALINELLDLRRVEEGRAALTLVPLSLADTLGSTLELLRPLADGHGVTLHDRLVPGLAVCADPQRLRQVLMNIVSNAIKYNRAGGWVDVSCRVVDAGDVAIDVQDSGSGLDAQQLARLFQPFERLGHEGSAIEGSGLGLVIARSLVDEMHGRLSLSSEPGAGTCATIALPRAELPQALVSDAPAASASAPAAAESRSEALKMRLLYVEDNRINALLFEEALKLRDDIELRIAEDAAQALALAVEWSPQLLVLDAHLPDMNGIELLARLRERPELAQVPAFMCSADAMPDDIRRAHHAGFVGYWTKPIDIGRIMADLDRLIAQHGA